MMWNNTGPNFKYFSTSSCLSLGQIELIKYLQFSFTLASSNSVLSAAYFNHFYIFLCVKIIYPNSSFEVMLLLFGYV